MRFPPLTFCLTAFPLPVWATSEAAPGVSSGSFLQAFIGLFIIVALLIATAWLARKLTGGRGFGQGGMRLIGGITIGPRERIILVEAGEHWLVIGIVPGQIRKLHTLPKGEFPEATLLPAGTPPFADWLKRVIERRNSSHAA